MSDFVIYDEVFLEGVLRLDLVPFQPDTVIDCGASRGILACSRAPGFRRPRGVIAFEPNVENLAGLPANVPGMRPDHRVALHCEAVSTLDGRSVSSGAVAAAGSLVSGAADTVTRTVRVVDLPPSAC